MKIKIKKPLYFFLLSFLSLGVFSNASAAPGDCGNNFSASFLYAGKRLNASDPFTTIVPTGYEFKTHLSVSADGEGEFSAGENVEIVLVMDRSGSMDETVNDIKKIEAAKNALNIVADAFVASSDVNNRLALVTYNENVTLDQTLTSNYVKVKNAIDSFSAQGQTNISGALMNAGNQLKSNSDSDAKKFIVIASDGKQNVGMPISFGIESVANDTTVFAVGIGKDADADLLKKVAEESGNKQGSYYSSNVGDLATIFTEIIEDILIPFRPVDIEATFYRKNADKFSLISTSPVYTSVSSGEITWNNLGSMLNGAKRDFDLVYNQAGGVGVGMPINTGELLMKYNLFDNVCSEIVPIEIITIENEPQCIGAIPLNTKICDGDELGLSAETSRKVVAGCSTSNKCEYICKEGFDLKNGKCVMKGICGVTEDSSWCRNEPESGWCGAGSSLVEGPNPVGDRWVWSCSGLFGGPNTICRAIRACSEGWREVSL